MKLDNFIGMMTGHFDNKEQFNMMQAAGKIYPYAKHVNTVCNDKINRFARQKAIFHFFENRLFILHRHFLHAGFVDL